MYCLLDVPGALVFYFVFNYYHWMLTSHWLSLSFLSSCRFRASLLLCVSLIRAHLTSIIFIFKVCANTLSFTCVCCDIILRLLYSSVTVEKSSYLSCSSQPYAHCTWFIITTIITYKINQTKNILHILSAISIMFHYVYSLLLIISPLQFTIRVKFKNNI